MLLHEAMAYINRTKLNTIAEYIGVVNASSVHSGEGVVNKIMRVIADAVNVVEAANTAMEDPLLMIAHVSLF